MGVTSPQEHPHLAGRDYLKTFGPVLAQNGFTSPSSAPDSGQGSDLGQVWVRGHRGLGDERLGISVVLMG